MATTQGSKALYNDVKNWYTVFNNLAANYSSGITPLTVPSSGTNITAAQINNLHDKIDAFRKDYYLKTVSAYWPQGVDVVKGSHIKPINLSAILATVSNAAKVVCKNTAACSSGTQGSGTHDNGVMSNTKHGCYTQSYQGNAPWTHSNGDKGCYTYSCGTKDDGAYSNGSEIDITNSRGTINRS